MTNSAWIFMLATWGIIIAATGYCFWKLLSSDQRSGSDEP